MIVIGPMLNYKARHKLCALHLLIFTLNLQYRESSEITKVTLHGQDKTDLSIAKGQFRKRLSLQGVVNTSNASLTQVSDVYTL